MKLGIAVVYLVLPGDEELIDLHLRYIEQCTRASFTIYGATNRLPDHLVERLAKRPSVRMCAIPPTEQRGSVEVAYYLERLIAEAISEGSTHVATLHVDSFPIRVGWEAQLEREISPEYAFAAAMREEDRFGKPTTACLFFPREFYTRHRPKLLLTRDDLRSHAGRRYARKLWNPREAGTGYGFVAFRESLRWLPLLRTNRNADHYYFGSIHGDVVFHLGAAAHAMRSFPGARERRMFMAVRQAVATSLPRPARQLLRRLIPNQILFPEIALHQGAHNQVKQALLENPELYIGRLRAEANEPPWSVGPDPNTH